MNKKFLSTKELGSLLGVTRQTVRNWIKKGEIKAFHIGQNLKIPVEEALRVILHYELPVPDWLKDVALASLRPSGRGRYRKKRPWSPQRSAKQEQVFEVTSNRVF